MLVLSRQKDETIMIGDDIEITVVDIKGDKVRLGIRAPTKIPVHRKEVYDAIKAEKEADARRHPPAHTCTAACPPPTRPAPVAKTTRGTRSSNRPFRSSDPSAIAAA